MRRPERVICVIDDDTPTACADWTLLNRICEWRNPAVTGLTLFDQSTYRRFVFFTFGDSLQSVDGRRDVMATSTSDLISARTSGTMKNVVVIGVS